MVEKCKALALTYKYKGLARIVATTQPVLFGYSLKIFMVFTGIKQNLCNWFGLRKWNRNRYAFLPEKPSQV